jgi:hypothetical protein
MECFNARGPEGEKRPLVLSARPRKKSSVAIKGKKEKQWGNILNFSPIFYKMRKA